MAYTPGQPFSYGIPDGTYRGRPTTASCYEKDGKLILDVNFAVIDPNTGDTYKKENGYDWEAKKRHWLTNKDGGFNEATINGLKEWTKGLWAPASFNDFFWFQQPDANGTPFGNLAAVGEVELNFQLDKQGNQQLWVHDPGRARGNGRTAYVPEGGMCDAAQLQAKWGAKAKALFAATPKKVGPAAPMAANPAPTPAAPVAPANVPSAAPARPADVPARPTAAPAAAMGKPWAAFPQSADGAFAYYCSILPEKYDSAKHDEKWFAIYDQVAGGKDPDQFNAADVQRLFQAVSTADMPF
jgi:hypothetical protein